VWLAGGESVVLTGRLSVGTTTDSTHVIWPARLVVPTESRPVNTTLSPPASHTAAPSSGCLAPTRPNRGHIASRRPDPRPEPLALERVRRRRDGPAAQPAKTWAQSTSTRPSTIDRTGPGQLVVFSSRPARRGHGEHGLSVGVGQRLLGAWPVSTPSGPAPGTGSRPERAAS